MFWQKKYANLEKKVFKKIKKASLKTQFHHFEKRIKFKLTKFAQNSINIIFYMKVQMIIYFFVEN